MNTQTLTACLRKTPSLRPCVRMFSTSRLRSLKINGFDSTHIRVSEVLADAPPEEVKYRNIFLRDACTSEESVNVHSSQKTFSTAEIPVDLAIKTAEITPQVDGKQSLGITWSDGRVSTYSHAFLERNATLQARRNFRYLDKPYTLWDSTNKPLTADLISKVDYKEFMTNPDAVNKAVQALHDFGVVYVENMPEQTGIVADKLGELNLDVSSKEPPVVLVEEVAKQIGYVKETFYGRSWNVKSVPEAKNVAYTSVYLPLHMDLLYYESPPGVQLLHVIHNSTVGGESIFADSYAAATHVLRTDPAAYDALTKVPISYHYDNDGYHYYYSRPLVVEDPYGGINPETNKPFISVINYSPPFQGPLDALAPGSGFSDEQVDAFLRGLRSFENYIEDKKNQIEFKMEENCCVIFMNRRALHARNEFQALTGRRWFRGAYLDLDSYQSKLRVANNLTRH